MCLYVGSRCGAECSRGRLAQILSPAAGARRGARDGGLIERKEDLDAAAERAAGTSTDTISRIVETGVAPMYERHHGARAQWALRVLHGAPQWARFRTGS